MKIGRRLTSTVRIVATALLLLPLLALFPGGSRQDDPMRLPPDAALVRAHGWPAVDALYSALPTTTEQMLHLDKLLAREAPIAVVADPTALAALLPGQSVVWQDNLGEATLLTMLADVEPAPIARAAAAGWGGDRYLALDRQPAGAAPLNRICTGR